MPIVELLGSGEFEPWARPVDSWCAEHASAPSERVLLVPTASAPEGEEVFQRWAAMGTEHYRAIDLNPELVPLRVRADAVDPAIVDMVDGARLIFFSGGNPGYLAESVVDTPFWEAVNAAVGSGATAIGGCSAGAVFLGAMAPFVSELSIDRWVIGTSLLARAYLMPHFDMLESYQPGLRKIVMDVRPTGTVGIGLDENTAMYGDGESWQIAGSGAIWVQDEGISKDGLVAHRLGETLTLRLL
jgi:cyanophycinase